MSPAAGQGGKRRGRLTRSGPRDRPTQYRHLRHPFSAQAIFSDDEIAHLHETALRVLAELGLKILLPEARQILGQAGARVEEEMVFIGADLVEAALDTAPGSFVLRAPNPDRQNTYETGALLFMAGAGCPNVSDRERGRRPGTLEAFIETTKLQQSFDIIHMLGPSAEPQEIPAHERHYATVQAQMQWSDKPINVNARGRACLEQCFEMIQLGLGLSAAEFVDGVWATGVINSNSPRVLDRPMAQGVIDLARARQLAIITPFCLAGAMAPITVAGALVLQHAEALGAIVLSQMAQPGAPVSYGGFSSNVDMKSGSPAFGTPEHLKMQIGAGQLARFVGLPWRSASGSAANLADAQGATETVNGLWGGAMAHATLLVHAAGWLEGGLTFGYEKFITDLEALQTLAELCARTLVSEAEIGFDAIADVPPGGHFFDTDHTMARYDAAFYAPLNADLSNFGTWTEAGAQSAETRATARWRAALDNYVQPRTGFEVEERLASYIAKGKENGGAPLLD